LISIPFSSVLNKVRQAHQIWQHLGPEWLAYRLSYAARMRTGMLRRKLPATDWTAQPLGGFLDDTSLADPQNYLDYRRAQAPAFFFAPSQLADYQPYFSAWDEEAITPVTLSEEIAKGNIRYFERIIANTGFPPDWHANPFTRQRAPADLHWSRIGDFGYGDIKIIWEPSRFAFAYALVRAYWRTGDDAHAERFWRLVEDWQFRNPPQQGPNWKCGQEISFRVMAWCFGLYGLLDSQATTATRVAALAQMIAVSGYRIEANLDYALSQRNNHGISEGLGLWTIGSFFPELRSAAKWRETGREVLESQAAELIYEDGSFSQHSVNYHRLMLQDYLWAIRLGEILDQPFSDGLKNLVSKAGEFLYQIQDQASGRVPYYGQNDGALILPLNNCDYQDFRPVVQATHYLSRGTRLFSSGQWDEDLLWLFGVDALSSPVSSHPRDDFKAEQGGYYTIRSGDGFAFTRCARFRHRPAQADLLHVDLWWRGQNIAMDAGTFSYNAPAPWNNPLARTAYHNTVTVDERDQMERVGKFLWLPWAQGRVLNYRRSQALAYCEGEHDGYERLNPPSHHRRAIVRLGDQWLVLDDLTSEGEPLYRLHWLLLDAPYEWDERAGRLALETAEGSYYVQAATLDGKGAYSIARADESSPRGWRAPYYNYREPALSFELTARAHAVRFFSLFGPEPCRVTANELGLELQTKAWKATVTLRQSDNAGQSIANSISITGEIADQMEID
jgi:asparagine synthase (glutamine-hydrolysing)